jgi:hypothetical protein
MREHRRRWRARHPRMTLMRGRRPLGGRRPASAAMTHARHQSRPGGIPVRRRRAGAGRPGASAFWAPAPWPWLAAPRRLRGAGAAAPWRLEASGRRPRKGVSLTGRSPSEFGRKPRKGVSLVSLTGRQVFTHESGSGSASVSHLARRCARVYHGGHS